EGGGVGGCGFGGWGGGAGGRVVGGLDAGVGGFDFHRLGFAAALGFLVVGVGGVGRDPVVGAGCGRGGAAGGFIAAVGGHRHGARSGERRGGEGVGGGGGPAG